MSCSRVLPGRWDSLVLDAEPSLDLGFLVSSVDEAFQKYPGRVNPPRNDVFRAFESLDLEDIRVVLIGQDPYPGHGVADGLAFSTRSSKTPASLLNIHKELCAEFGVEKPVRNDLTYLAEQGVFLYNTSLISLDGTPLFFSKNPLFALLSRAVVEAISNRGRAAFILLGRAAQSFEKCVDTAKNCVLKAAHPSPLSAHHGFFGSGIFSRCNQELEKFGYSPIEWL